MEVYHEQRHWMRYLVSLFFYANSELQPNAKYSCAASVAIAR